MTEGQYESGDKREREKVAAKKGCEVKRLGEEMQKSGQKGGEKNETESSGDERRSSDK